MRMDGLISDKLISDKLKSVSPSRHFCVDMQRWKTVIVESGLRSKILSASVDELQVGIPEQDIAAEKFNFPDKRSASCNPNRIGHIRIAAIGL